MNDNLHHVKLYMYNAGRKRICWALRRCQVYEDDFIFVESLCNKIIDHIITVQFIMSRLVR